MKIVLNTQSAEIINQLMRFSKLQSPVPVGYEDKNIELQASRVESGLFDSISDTSVDAYLIEIPSSYSQKGVDFIKKRHPYIPVILFGPSDKLTEVAGADIYMPFDIPEAQAETVIYKGLYEASVKNIAIYLRNFEKLRKLTTKMASVIDFGQCKYDPTRRTLLHKEVEVKKLSAKEGGILEVLSSNFGEVVKKEIILEKVWHKSDYFSGRSMDVYVTHLRRLFKENEIDINIKNISGVGLILE